jgi:hypothetical protein
MPRRRPWPRTKIVRRKPEGGHSIEGSIPSIRDAGQLPQLSLQVLKVDGLRKKICCARRVSSLAAQEKSVPPPLVTLGQCVTQLPVRHSASDLR